MTEEDKIAKAVQLQLTGTETGESFSSEHAAVAAILVERAGKFAGAIVAGAPAGAPPLNMGQLNIALQLAYVYGATQSVVGIRGVIDDMQAEGMALEDYKEMIHALAGGHELAMQASFKTISAMTKKAESPIMELMKKMGLGEFPRTDEYPT